VTVDVVNDALNAKAPSVIKLAAANESEQTLLHELQLGEQLNKSIHQARRADFSLMLAMLSDDVREQSQFILPKQNDDNYTADIANNETLRKHFDLPPQAPLSLDNLKQINQYNQMQSIIDDELSALHLSNVLSPQPLAFRDDSKYISSEIMANTSEICQAKHNQAKHNQESTSSVLNKPLNMNVEGWLKAIDISLVKSTLVKPVAA